MEIKEFRERKDLLEKTISSFLGHMFRKFAVETGVRVLDFSTEVTTIEKSLDINYTIITKIKTDL